MLPAVGGFVHWGLLAWTWAALVLNMQVPKGHPDVTHPTVHPAYCVAVVGQLSDSCCASERVGWEFELG